MDARPHDSFPSSHSLCCRSFPRRACGCGTKGVSVPAGLREAVPGMASDQEPSVSCDTTRQQGPLGPQCWKVAQSLANRAIETRVAGTVLADARPWRLASVGPALQRKIGCDTVRLGGQSRSVSHLCAGRQGPVAGVGQRSRRAHCAALFIGLGGVAHDARGSRARADLGGPHDRARACPRGLRGVTRARLRPRSRSLQTR